MVIANPIYDVVFKRLMENDKIAKFFIGTLLNQIIETIEIKPQEYTYKGEFEPDDPNAEKIILKRMKERFNIWVYRLDYIATVRDENGEYKKILIEIQKANNDIDLMRFRNYLAEQYKKEDTINNEKVALPITTIYILGFNLPEIASSCIKVARNYIDLVNNGTIINEKSELIESLTHDCYVVQVKKITDKYQTRLDKLLSIFEQRNFINDSEITKSFLHKIDIEEVKEAIDILHYVGTDPIEKAKIENEQEALRTLDVMLGKSRRKLQQKIEEQNKILNKNKKVIEENKKVLNENKKVINENKKVINENKKVINENKKILEENKKNLQEKDKVLNENKKVIEEKNQALQEKDKLIDELMKKLKTKN